MEDINMINEIESIFSKSEISLEDISDLQTKDIYYEGKVTDFIKGSYDKAKKIVSAIFSFIKKAIEKMKPILAKIGNKMKSLYKHIITKIKSHKSATESFGISVEEFIQDDQELISVVNQFVSLVASYAIICGATTISVNKKIFSGKRTYINAALFGVLYSVIAVAEMIAYPPISAPVIAACGALGVGVGFGITKSQPNRNKNIDVRFFINGILKSVLMSIMSKRGINLIIKQSQQYATDLYKILSSSDENRMNSAKSLLDKVLQKNDWVKSSDIGYNTNIIERINKLKSSESKKKIAENISKLKKELASELNQVNAIEDIESYTMRVTSAFNDLKSLVSHISITK